MIGLDFCNATVESVIIIQLLDPIGTDRLNIMKLVGSLNFNSSVAKVKSLKHF